MPGGGEPGGEPPVVVGIGSGPIGVAGVGSGNIGVLGGLIGPEGLVGVNGPTPPTIGKIGEEIGNMEAVGDGEAVGNGKPPTGENGRRSGGANSGLAWPPSETNTGRAGVFIAVVGGWLGDVGVIGVSESLFPHRVLAS